MRLRFSAILLFCCAANLHAQAIAIPDEETRYAPTPARLNAVCDAAKRDGWGPQIAGLRAAALQAYRRENLVVAEAWFHVYLWANLFAEPEANFLGRWINAVNAAKVGHANMPRTFDPKPGPLGAALSPELQRWLIGETDFSNEFFALVNPVDYLPAVFETLTTLHRADPTRFKTYANLALAIAVVFDVPPPPHWPHAQVTPEALPRRFPAALDAFAWWIKQEQAGRTGGRLRQLRADELKYVVDAAAPFAELEWAQQNVNVPIAEMPRAYTMIRYKFDRVNANQPVWPGKTYRLADVLATGGICADQAYFATEVGKSRGVPTLFFHGAGNDGRHAWFGYLDGQTWQLDAGRYAEQRFVTGFAHDPQTWREFSDHELQFLREHFRSSVSYRQSRVHTAFAIDLLAGGDAAGAAVAARKAVRFEPRNQDGWETLVAATKAQGGIGKPVEVILREAALAYQRYPDLEAFYVGRVVESLRARGQTSEADAEVRRIARKNQDSRVDISVQQARDIVLRAMQTQPMAEQVRAYNSVVDAYGSGAGISFFDEVVVIFVEHLMQLQNRPEALRAVERARRTLAVEPKSQLERELDRLQAVVEGRARK